MTQRPLAEAVSLQTSSELRRCGPGAGFDGALVDRRCVGNAYAPLKY
jgi:hypothetical protein